MKNKMDNNFRLLYRKNAITLIALVITIVILLILAGVTIVTLTGENGLLRNTSDVSEEYKKAQVKEEIQLAIADIQAQLFSDKKIKMASISKFEIAGNKENFNMNTVIKYLPDRLNVISEELWTDSTLDEPIGKYKGYNFVVHTTFEVDIIGINSEIENDVEQKDIATLWLKSANINAENTLTLDQIINDENIITQLMNNQDSINFMIENEEIKTKILNNSKCIEIMDNSQYNKKIDSMISNQNAQGSIIYSSYFSSGYEPWRAFDRNTADFWNAARETNSYIGFSYNQEINLYKCFIGNAYYDWNSKNYSVKVQYLDENTQEWIDIKSADITVSSDTYLVLDTFVKAKQFRIYMDTQNHSYGYSLQRSIQFYGF